MEQPGSSFSSSEIPSDELELMRLVISCIRESTMVSTAQGPALEGPVCRVIALQARQRYQTVYTMWCDLRAVALRKLRAHLARGDISTTEERLTTLEWAVVDILLLYDTSLLSVASLPQLAQREALQRTFELVQRFQLEPEHGGAVLPHTWTLAADSYSRNGVELSALALQRRWHEMKTLARRHAGGPATPSILQAIVHRYPHVRSGALPAWRRLRAARALAAPTAVPSPRPDPAPQCKPIPGDCAPRQRRASAVATRNNAETDDRLGKKDDVQDRSKDTSSRKGTLDQGLVSSNNNDEEDHCDNTDNIQQHKQICIKDIDKTDIKVKPEITEIDDDTPSPKADVVEAMQDIDLSNVDAMIVYESDEDVKTIFDVQMGNFDKNSDVVRNEEHSENVINHNKIITSQSKYKILTDCIIERDVDCDIMSFKQNEDNSSNTANLSGNNNKSIDDPEENSMDLVISNVWSERAVTPTCNVKKSLHNETENSSNDNSDSDSDIVSVGNDVDYYSYYYDMILAKHVVKSDLDAKLLTRPVVSLQRIDLKSINKSPTTQNPQRTVRTSTKLLYEKNKELLKQCKACEVSLTRVGRVGRKTRKVKLPDIEKVRKDNQGILTAEVAPLVAGQPRVIRQYGPAQTKRFHNTTDNDRSVSTKSVRGSPKSTILKNTEKTHALSNTVCQNPLIQQQQNDLINNPPESNVQSHDENDGQEWNSNVTFNSISNLTQQISENGLQASKIKNLQTIPDAQDKSTNNIVTNILETQDPSLNMLDTCQVSTVTPIPNTPTMKTTKSTPMPNPPAEIQPIKLPKLPVLIPNPPIRIPKPGSTPVPTVPLLTPPVKLPKFELIPKQSVPTPNLPTLTPKLEPMPIPNPPTTRTPKPKKKAALKGFVPLSNLATLTPKLEPFTPAQYPPEMLTPKLEPGLDPSMPTPNPSTMLTPKTEPFASISSDSTDLDQICAIYSDNYSPISTVAANDFNPFTHIQVTQPTLLNSTLNSSLEPSKHSESSIIQVSLTRSAPIPDTPTSPAASLKPSFRTHVYKYTKKPCKKESSIKPYILEFALKQSGNQVILKPINSTKKATTKKEPRKQEAEKGPWRMEHESFDESEFDMDMTFAEAYHLFGESDTSFERSVPLLNLL